MNNHQVGKFCQTAQRQRQSQRQRARLQSQRHSHRCCYYLLSGVKVGTLSLLLCVCALSEEGKPMIIRVNNDVETRSNLGRYVT